MKKFVIALSAVFMMLGTLVFTGCEFDEAFAGPTNKWCEKEIQYGEDGTRLDAYLFYSVGGYTPTPSILDDSGIDFSETGLYVVIKGSSDKIKNNAILSALADDKYAVFFWKDGSSLSFDANDTETINHKISLFSCSTNMWTTICVFNPSLTEEPFKKVPDFLRKGSGYKKITDTKAISWKKIMAQILIDELLKE